MAERELYTFGETTARKLQDWAHRLPAEQRNIRTEKETYTHHRLFQAPEGGIPAEGSAMCKVVYIDANDQKVVTDKEFKVHNWLVVVVCEQGSRYGTADKDGYGKWLINAADCADTG